MPFGNPMGYLQGMGGFDPQMMQRLKAIQGGGIMPPGLGMAPGATPGFEALRPGGGMAQGLGAAPGFQRMQQGLGASMNPDAGGFRGVGGTRPEDRRQRRM